MILNFYKKRNPYERNQDHIFDAVTKTHRIFDAVIPPQLRCNWRSDLCRNPRGDADLARFIESVKSFSFTGSRISKKIIFRKPCFHRQNGPPSAKSSLLLVCQRGGWGPSPTPAREDKIWEKRARYCGRTDSGVDFDVLPFAHCNSFGATPIEDRGFEPFHPLPRWLRRLRFERPLSRIVAFGPFMIHLESHSERPLSKILAFGQSGSHELDLMTHLESHLERPLSKIVAFHRLISH